jgi:heat shock protein HtpX
MIVFKFSRWREFRADAAGAQLAGRNDMIAALERLRRARAPAQDLPGELTAFGISEQLKQGMARCSVRTRPLRAHRGAAWQATEVGAVTEHGPDSAPGYAGPVIWHGRS